MKKIMIKIIRHFLNGLDFILLSTFQNTLLRCPKTKRPRNSVPGIIFPVPDLLGLIFIFNYFLLLKVHLRDASNLVFFLITATVLCQERKKIILVILSRLLTTIADYFLTLTSSIPVVYRLIQGSYKLKQTDFNINFIFSWQIRGKAA